ncbi:hypothetical protein K501DRAFT_175763 [Backusella circina FSU 941]|nr:hypothetical protein K501DRAFT_175763 [Backusella circina FSU 941]
MSKARIIGELVIVAYKALVGKQDPFVVLRLGENTRKTRTDYRGGQHPIWDDQINIPVPEKKNMMVVQVYDEDSKREDLISETEVDITKVLEDGEWDSWHPLVYKGRSAGEIYLEMTFYSARPPPKRQPTRFGNKKRPVSGGYVPPMPQQHQRPPPQQMMHQQYPPSGHPGHVPIESTSTPTYGSGYPPQQNARPLHPQHGGINSSLPPPVPTPSISTGSNHMYPPQGRPQGTSRPVSYNGPSAQPLPPNSNYGQTPASGHAPLLSSSYNPTPRPGYGGK